MIGFFIKKNFFDGWENIINILVPNLISICTIALAAVGIYFWANATAITGFLGPLLAVFSFYLIIFLVISLLIVFCAAFAQNALKIANYETANLGDYFSQLPNTFKNYHKFAFLLAFIIIASVVGIPIYIRLNSFYGVMFAMILLAVALIFLLALQWYIPISVLIGGDFKKILKKCFVILFDNFAFSIFIAVYSLFLFGISIFLLLTLPGFNGILLGQINALRLRLYKYDWLDEHPNLKVVKERKNIPWEPLLKEDELSMGNKSLRSLFLPWKADNDE